MPAASGTGDAATPPSTAAEPGGPPAPPGPADPVLSAERDHLRRSREFLRLMREDVLGLEAMAGDRVSQEHLKADLYHRAQALRDIPDVPLFFGRLDYAEGAVMNTGTLPAGTGQQEAAAGEGGGGGGPAGPGRPGQALPGERLHIGRRHIHDRDGHPVVIDWRAPVSRPFYRASAADPMGLARRRRFGFAGAELTAYEDEEFTRPGQPAGAAPPVSRILIEEIERPRSGPMRDIVATIQPDQDDIVRASADQSLCVQGAPGTGKTAVGLHRVAYLLYAHPGRMLRGGVLVIGPNRAFLSYIRGVLPALGEADVIQRTIPDLVATVPVRVADSGPTARVKGDARMAEVLRRALWAGLNEPAEALVLARGSWRWRVHGHEIAELMQELRERGVRYGAGRTMLSHRIAHVVLTRMEAAGEATDDRTHEAVRRTRRSARRSTRPGRPPIRSASSCACSPIRPCSPAPRTVSSIRPSRRRSAGTGRPAGRAARAGRPPTRCSSTRPAISSSGSPASPTWWWTRHRTSRPWSAGRSGGAARPVRPPCSVTSRRPRRRAAEASWPRLLAHLGKPEAGMQVLDTGYRVPRQILDFASLLLPVLAPGLAPARSLRQDPGSLAVTPVTPRALPGLLATVCGQALARPGSAAVIASDEQVPALHRALGAAGIGHQVLDGAEADGRLILLPVTLAKGLEFDDVIVVEPARIAAQPRGLHRLYVALTRAVSRLTVLHTEPLPGPLG